MTVAKNIPTSSLYLQSKNVLITFSKTYHIILGQGRYGSVWHGVVEDQDVAVKVFPAHHRNYFLNEHEMYKVSGENSALLKCFGGGEYTMGPSGPDYVLLLSLEQECLQVLVNI